MDRKKPDVPHSHQPHNPGPQRRPYNPNQQYRQQNQQPAAPQQPVSVPGENTTNVSTQPAAPQQPGNSTRYPSQQQRQQHQNFRQHNRYPGQQSSGGYRAAYSQNQQNNRTQYNSQQQYQQQNFPAICLMTDFGLIDPYVGIMKGVIKKINSKIDIIDITHNIQPQNILEAAFILYNSYKYFPANTIFTCVIDPGVGTDRKCILVKTKSHYFIAPDNGILTFILRNEEVLKIVEITNDKYFLAEVSGTFHGRDVFAPASAWLSVGQNISQFGSELVRAQCMLLDKVTYEPIYNNRTVTGKVLFSDRFGNLITNINVSYLKRHWLDWDKVLKDTQIIIKKKKFTGLHKNYKSIPAGKPVAIIGSYGYIEISLNSGDAKKYFGFEKAELPVEISLNEK